MVSMKRKMGLTWVAVLAMTALFSAMAASVQADQLSLDKQKQKTLQGQQQQTKQQIASLSQQERSLNDQINTIQAQVNALDVHIVSTQSQLAARQQQMDALKAQISKTQAQIDAQSLVLEQRIRVMYEDGNTSYLDVLFSATSFADLLDRLSLLSMIAQADKRVLTGIQSAKQALNRSHQQLAQTQAQQQAAYQSLVADKAKQQSAQVHEQSLLQSVHSVKLKDQMEFNSESAALNNLKSDIQQILAQQGAFTTVSGWTWPVPASHSISSGYGERSFDGGSFHNGIDIPGSIGTPIVSATEGRVLLAGPASGFGDWVVIQSSGGLLEIYGHMFSYEIKVSPGQVVQEGQEIAEIGNNGFSTGPHLHFTIATGFDSAGFAISVNPLNYVHP